MSAFAADDPRIDVWYWPRQGADRLLVALGHHVGRAVDTTELVRTVDGQPRLRRSELAFSISHSGAWTVVAISHAPVGIDLERVVPLPELDDVVALAFTPAERDGLARCAAPRKETWFYDCWTRKEALAKAMGCGFRDGPMSVDSAAAPGWRFIRWSPGPGYAGCVATRLDRPRIVVRGVPHSDASWEACKAEEGSRGHSGGQVLPQQNTESQSREQDLPHWHDGRWRNHTSSAAHD